MFRTQQPQQPLRRQRSLPSLNQAEPSPQGPTATNDVAIQKISALENELASLRAQIAQIVLAQERSANTAGERVGGGREKGGWGQERGRENSTSEQAGKVTISMTYDHRFPFGEEMLFNSNNRQVCLYSPLN